MNPIVIPELSVVVLIGSSGSGKSSFARKHFLPTEVISSDFCRGLVSDDETSLEATSDAFDLLHFIVEKRLAAGRIAVIDATNVQSSSRRPLVELARKYHAVTVAIALDVPPEVCIERNKSRPDRQFGPHVVRNHARDLRRSIPMLGKERFRYVYVLHSVNEIDRAEIVREPVWTNRKTERGPFDIIGDIHGCFDELIELMTTLGYAIDDQGKLLPPEGRKAVFLGDLVDRGPKSPEVLRLTMDMVGAGHALCVPGNHDEKLHKKLMGKSVIVRHGLEKTLEQLENSSPEFLDEVKAFLDGLISHFVLDQGRLVVAHAGMKQEFQGRASGTVREFALYGETTGEMDEFGLPVRYNWASEYRGSAKVVYGHTPVREPEWLNGTINIDTGCVFGGKLTALRYPEMELVSVTAKATYAESKKPFLIEAAPELSSQHSADELLDISDVVGKRHITTKLRGTVTIQEENAAAALEVMSRFAANPKWLAYLPPTMSPTETSQHPSLLEHPLEALEFYRSHGARTVICEEKHMGSRAVVALCRNEDVARKRFGVSDEGSGIVTTRTGRRFFENMDLESAFLERIRGAANATGFWDEHETDWAILDCELMPWSAKAQELLKKQYAAVGAAAQASTHVAVEAAKAASELGSEGAAAIADRLAEKAALADKFVTAYSRYCWPVRSIEDLRLAPFHVLATEGKVHANRDHTWHMASISKLCEGDSLLIKTPFLRVDLDDSAACGEAVEWWTDLTEKGGEGMVVKPLDFVFRGPHGLEQPAVKCRGRDYLRIIYGPEYDLPANLGRLKRRSLARKRSLALREFALGIEALERFVAHEPLRRVHECVFGVLALESEPVDPRL